MKFNVNVTQADIDDGYRASAFGCPIALAINNEIKKIDKLYYCGTSIMSTMIFNSSCFSICIVDFKLPVKAACFIRDFDEGLFVQPFSFELEIEI